MNLQVSIALCTYNGELFLKEQLESFTRQTHLPDELVVCDDGSSDDTLCILENFTQNAPFPVRIYKNERNLGYSLNFQKSAQLCEKDIIFFSDQDDIWLPEKVERALKVFQEHPEIGMVLLTANLINQNGALLRRKRGIHYNSRIAARIHDESISFLMKRCLRAWQGCNMAYRRCLNDVIYPVYPYEGHDHWVFLLLSVLSRIMLLPEPTMLYRRHAQNVTKRSRGDQNFLESLSRAIRRHQDPVRYENRADFLRMLLDRIKEHSELILFPELPLVYSRYETHYSARASAIRNVRARASIIFREIWNGNYASCSRGIIDVFSDLLAWPAENRDKVSG